jgi:hypothetical protein
MIVIEQLTLEHARTMSIQEAQLSVGPLMASDDYMQSLIDAGPAHALVVDGIPMIMAGTSIFWKGRAFGWAIVSKLAGPHMKVITKEVRKFLDNSDIRRIETAVDCRFEAGHRWASLLGFKFEGKMEAWGPQGNDFDLYARVKHG